MTADIRMALENELDHLDESNVESWLQRCFESCDPRYDTDWLMGMFELALMQFPDNYEVRAAASKSQTMEAQRLFDEGDTQDAVARLEKLLESDPYCTEAFEMLERFMAGDGGGEVPPPPPTPVAELVPPPAPEPVAVAVEPLTSHHSDELLSFLDEDLNIGIDSVLEPDLPTAESGEPAPVPALTLTPPVAVPEPEPVLAAVAASGETAALPTLTLAPEPVVELMVSPPVAEVAPVIAPVAPPAPQPVSEPAPQPLPPPPPEPVAQPAPQPLPPPPPEPVAQPTSQPLAPPPPEPVAQPAPQPMAPPPPQSVAQPARQPLAPPPLQPVAQPASQPMTPPQPQPVAQPAAALNGSFDWRSVVGLPGHAQSTLEPQLEAILPSLTERFTQVGNYRSLVMLLTDFYQRDPSHQGVSNNLNSVLNDWANHLEKQGRGSEAGQVAAWSQQLLGARANWAAPMLARFPAQPPSLPDLSGLSSIASPGWMNWISPLRDDPSRFQEAGTALAHDPQGLQSLFRHLAVQHSDSADHVLNLGWAYSHTGQHALAMVHTQRSLQMRQSPRAYQLLQKIYLDLGQPDMAQRVAQQLASR